MKGHKLNLVFLLIVLMSTQERVVQGSSVLGEVKFESWNATASNRALALSTPDDSGKACPGCASANECSPAISTFGIPVIQLITAAVVGVIWAAIFIGIVAGFATGGGSQNNGGFLGFDGFDFLKRNDVGPSVPAPNYAANSGYNAAGQGQAQGYRQPGRYPQYSNPNGRLGRAVEAAINSTKFS